MAYPRDLRARRRRRHVRFKQKVSGMGKRPRLRVFRSLKHIYAQVIDDTVGQTIASASTLDPEIKSEAKVRSKTEAAKLIGALVGKQALDRGISQVVFDRAGYKYHGRVKALAEGAKEKGLKF